jgi:hypothetical protein
MEKKKSLTINKNIIEKIMRQMQIKLFNVTIRIIYLVVFSEFIY